PKPEPKENPLEQQEGDGSAPVQSPAVSNQPVQSSQQGEINNADGNLGDEQSQINSEDEDPDSDEDPDDETEPEKPEGMGDGIGDDMMAE
ncbi:MAG: hypothetical protein ACKO2V_13445, partial [Snowella sp.]